MWTPCDDPIDEYNEKTGKMETHHKCPYADTYAGYEDEMCRNCCGLGVDDDNYDYDEEQQFMKWNQELNPSQLKAADQINGQLLILAGAGSQNCTYD